MAAGGKEKAEAKEAGKRAEDQRPRRAGGSAAGIIAVVLILSLVGGGFLWVYLTRPPLEELLSRIPVLGRFWPAPARPQDDLAALKATLEKEKAALAAGRAELEQEKEAVDQRQRELDERQRQLEAMAAELEGEQGRVRTAEEKIDRLAGLYQEMKPQDAVEIISRLEDDLVVAVLERLEPRQAAAIIALMDAERAARLSRQIGK